MKGPVEEQKEKVKNLTEYLDENQEKIYDELVKIKGSMNQNQEDHKAWSRLIEIYMPIFEVWIRKRISRYEPNFRKNLSVEDLVQEAAMALFKKRKSFFCRCDCFDDGNDCPVAFTKWAQTVVKSSVFDQIRKTGRHIFAPLKADPEKEVKMILSTITALFIDLEIDLSSEEEKHFRKVLSDAYKAWFKKCPVIVDDFIFEKKLKNIVVTAVQQMNDAVLTVDERLSDEQMQAILNRIAEGELTDDIATIVDLRKKSGGMIIDKDLTEIEEFENEYINDGEDPYQAEMNRDAAQSDLHRCLDEVISNQNLPIEKVVFWIAYCFDLLKEPDREKGDIRKSVYQKSKGKKLGIISDQIKNDDNGHLNLTTAEFDLLCERLKQILIRQPISEAEQGEKTFELTSNPIKKIVDQCEKIEDSRLSFNAQIDVRDDNLIPKDVLRLVKFISMPCYETEREEMSATIHKTVEKNDKTTLTISQGFSEPVKDQLNALERLIREIKKIKELLQTEQSGCVTEDFFRYPDIIKKEKNAYTLEECLEDDHTKWARWIGTVNKVLIKKYRLEM